MQKPHANAVEFTIADEAIWCSESIGARKNKLVLLTVKADSKGQLSQVKTVAPHSSSPVYRYLGTVVSTIVTPLAENHTNVFHRAICTQLAPSSLTGPWVVTLSQAFTLIDRESDTIVTHVSLAQLVQCA
eukprot:gb/GECG01008864.1/.p1 GENE.gb/GECG01008864.1/~~gb/GECG01008864.1/.p1  ORF type:complete len:130 (+),score=10.92 gb/GECG01008864.1/:1-390(+)